MTNLHDNNQPTKAQLASWALQEKKVFACFYQEPRTMYQVSKLTGVERANICRFVGAWKKAGSIKVIRTGKDPYTKMHGVQFLSTNEMLWPKERLQNSAEAIKIDKYGQTIMFQ
jgi:hypothetical protein